MKVHAKPYINQIGEVLSRKSVLEIGCGNGLRSARLGEFCSSLRAIDPDEDFINQARLDNNLPNIQYQVGSAQSLEFPDSTFDSSIFTLSLHHVPRGEMPNAITEARRVTRQAGHLIFIEPTFDGSLFEAELHFNACDGDERAAKALAYHSILTASGLEEVNEFSGETIFEFSSLDDFKESMKPQERLDELEHFLEKHKYRLRAQRRINIFKIVA